MRLRCPSRTPEIARFPRQDQAILRCDLRVRWKVASDLRFRAAISEPKIPSFCGLSGDLAQSTRKALAIAIVRFWCAKSLSCCKWDHRSPLFDDMPPSEIAVTNFYESGGSLGEVLDKQFRAFFALHFLLCRMAHQNVSQHSPPNVAPYCAIPRDYLSDTPLLRAMGFLVTQHGQLGAIPPPPFLSVSPFENMRSGGAIPPPLKRGISAILARYPMKTRQMGCDTPLCDTISKGYCAIWGGISQWASQHSPPN